MNPTLKKGPSRLILAALSLYPIASAEEGGGGHYAPGSMATLIDLSPAQAGWTINPLYLYFEGDYSNARDLPLGGLATGEIKAATHAITLGGLYTFERQICDAWFSVGAYVPYVWMEVDATIRNVPIIGDVRASDSTSGIGDITIVPAMFAWKRDAWQYSAYLSVYAPTGKYELGALANTGLNYWKFEPGASVSYSNEETGFNWSLFGGVTFNTRNQDTDYQSGSVVHLDTSVQQIFPAGPGFLTLGAVGWYYQQVNGDSGSGATLGDTKGRSLGIGPAVGYLLPMGEEGSDLLAIEARWLPELDTRNRIEGDYLWLKLAWQF